MGSIPQVFSLIGVFFAIGDILEMQSMSAMDGAVYQVLGQSKLIVTAITLWAVKGHNQTALEWVVSSGECGIVTAVKSES